MFGKKPKRKPGPGRGRSHAEGRSASPPEAGIPVFPLAENQDRTSSIRWGVKRPRSRGRRILSNLNDNSDPSDRLNHGRDGVLTTDAEVQFDSHGVQHSPSPLVLNVAPPDTARSTRTEAAAENKRLVDEIEDLRKKLHAEDSAYKKELKTLKRKLYMVVDLCENHGVDVPTKMLMPSQLKTKRLKTTVTTSTPTNDVVQLPESNVGDEEDMEVGSDVLLLLHQAARSVEQRRVGYDWAAEVEAAEEECRHNANMVPEGLLSAPSRPAAQKTEEHEGLTPVLEDEDDMFIYPAPVPTPQAILPPPDAPDPTPEAPPPPPLMASEETQTEQTTGATQTQTDAPGAAEQTTQTDTPVAAQTAPMHQCQHPHRTCVDEIRDEVFSVKPVSTTGPSRAWLKRQRRNLRTLLTSMYGAAWLNGARGEEEAVRRATEIQPSIEGFHHDSKRLPSSEDVTQVLASVIDTIPGLWRALKPSRF